MLDGVPMSRRHCRLGTLDRRNGLCDRGVTADQLHSPADRARRVQHSDEDRCDVVACDSPPRDARAESDARPVPVSLVRLPGRTTVASSPLASTASSARPFARRYTLKVSSPGALEFAPMLLTIT